VQASIFVRTQAVQGNIDFFSFLEFFGVSSLLEQFSATGQDSLLGCGKPLWNCVPVGLENCGSIEHFPVSIYRERGRSIVHWFISTKFDQLRT
jgi:hypothetical protein